MILWYSGCGNSRFIAESLAGSLADKNLVFIPDAARSGIRLDFEDNGILGLVFPVYAWSVPNLVTDFIRNMKFTGKPAYIFAACTCGDNTGHTCRVMKKQLARRGLALDAFFAFQMPNTYINLPGFRLDPPELAKSKIEKTRHDIGNAVCAIENRAKGNFNRLTGNWPFFKTYILKPLFYLFVITDRKFHVNGSCNGCGLCARNCPLGNISIHDGHPQWNHNCTNCNSCYHRCPRSAIEFGHITGAATGQYFFRQD